MVFFKIIIYILTKIDYNLYIIRIIGKMMSKIDKVHIFSDVKTEQAFLKKVQTGLIARMDNADKSALKSASLLSRTCDVFKCPSIDGGSNALGGFMNLVESCSLELGDSLMPDETPEDTLLDYIERAGPISDAVAVAIAAAAINDAEHLDESVKQPLLKKIMDKFPTYIKGFDPTTMTLKSELQKLMELYGREKVLEVAGVDVDGPSTPPPAAPTAPPLSSSMPPVTSPASVPAGRAFLADIRKGKILKKAEPKLESETEDNTQAAILARAMAGRRSAIEIDEHVMQLDDKGFCRVNHDLETHLKDKNYQTLESYAKANHLYHALIEKSVLLNIYDSIEVLNNLDKKDKSMKPKIAAFLKNLQAVEKLKIDKEKYPEIDALQKASKELKGRTLRKRKSTKQANFLKALADLSAKYDLSQKKNTLLKDYKDMLSGAHKAINAFSAEVQSLIDAEEWI